MHSSPYDSLFSFNKLLLMKLLDMIKNNMINKSTKRDISIDVNTKFLVLYLSLAIKTLSAVGRPNCDKLINSKKVGMIIEYKPIPSVPINLVKIIFIIIPSIFVKKPPITKIKVAFINLFFILKFYSITK